MFLLEFHACVGEVMSGERDGRCGRAASEHTVRIARRRLSTMVGQHIMHRGEQGLREHVAATYPPYFGIDARTTTVLRAMVMARVFDLNE
jgi:hypothetical protein